MFAQTLRAGSIRLCGVQHIPYKQDNFGIMIPCYICEAKYPNLSAEDLNPQHCTIKQAQQLVRHSGLFYLRAGKIDMPAGQPIVQTNAAWDCYITRGRPTRRRQDYGKHKAMTSGFLHQQHDKGKWNDQLQSCGNSGSRKMLTTIQHWSTKHYSTTNNTQKDCW